MDLLATGIIGGAVYYVAFLFFGLTPEEKQGIMAMLWKSHRAHEVTSGLAAGLRILAALARAGLGFLGPPSGSAGPSRGLGAARRDIVATATAAPTHRPPPRSRALRPRPERPPRIHRPAERLKETRPRD